jgi:hypothetical protein
VDAQHEVIVCFECAPPEAMKQHWPVDEEEDSDSK